MSVTNYFTPIHKEQTANTGSSGQSSKKTTSDDKVYKFTELHLKEHQNNQNTTFNRSASKETLPGDSEHEVSEKMNSQAKSKLSLDTKITSAFMKSLKQPAANKYVVLGDLTVEDYED